MRSSWRHCLQIIGSLCLAVVATVTLTACKESQPVSELTVAGSTTVLPIAEIAAERFDKLHNVHVLVSGLGSSAGIEAVLNGTANIASSSRDLTKAEDRGSLIRIPIAHDGIAVIVNENNTVSNLTSEQLRDIYSGKITNWKELGGSDLPILVVNRDEASGTREAFHKLIMKNTPFERKAAVLPGTGQVRDVVSRTAGAIGYISIGFVHTSFATTKVKALDIDGVKATDANIESGKYPISRDLFFFTKGKPQGVAKEFIDYILSDKMADSIREAGYIPITKTQRGV